jgi:hypothetical protein
MNYERFKKLAVSMALTCVLAISVIATGASTALAQGYPRVYYPRDYGRWERQYYPDYGRRYRRVYRDPWVRYRYPYWYGYPRARYYPYAYPPGFRGRIGRFSWWWY